MTERLRLLAVRLAATDSFVALPCSVISMRVLSQRTATPFTIKSEDFVELGRPIIALDRRKERPAAVMRKKQACRRYNSLRSRSLSHLRGHQIECPDCRFSLSARLLLRAFEMIAPRARDQPQLRIWTVECCVQTLQRKLLGSAQDQEC